MQALDWATYYIGVDVVREIIESNRARHGSSRRRFLHADITSDELPAADLVLCRDGLVHMSFEHAAAALKQFAATGATYLLATTLYRHPENIRIKTGCWRPLNLTLPPFNFPSALRLIHERPTHPDAPPDKALGLWRLEDLI